MIVEEYDTPGRAVAAMARATQASRAGRISKGSVTARIHAKANRRLTRTR